MRMWRRDDASWPSCRISSYPSCLVFHLGIPYTSDFWCETRRLIRVLTCAEIRLRLYGSSCTKFGFKDSDVNIDIQFPQHVSNLMWKKKSWFEILVSSVNILFTYHIHMSCIVFMLYEGFEIECIHRCISQTSCCWSRRLSLCAVSYFLTLQLVQVLVNVLNLNCHAVSSALFVDVEADFHARVPVVLCKDKNWWAALSSNQFTKCRSLEELAYCWQTCCVSTHTSKALIQSWCFPQQWPYLQSQCW